jgi:hypothetical protein
MAISQQARRAQCVLAVRTRDYGPDHPATVAARGEFRSLAYLEAVRALVDDAPPLTAEQRARLSQILAPAVAAASAEGMAA